MRHPNAGECVEQIDRACDIFAIDLRQHVSDQNTRRVRGRTFDDRDDEKRRLARKVMPVHHCGVERNRMHGDADERPPNVTAGEQLVHDAIDHRRRQRRCRSPQVPSC